MAEDRGEIVLAERGAVLTKDTTPLQPDVLEYKLYRRDVGQVLSIDAAQGGVERLVSHRG